jgi:hypothetical protein
VSYADSDDVNAGFYLDDVPGSDYVVQPPDNVSLDEFTDATAELIRPDRTLVDLVAAIDDDQVKVEWSATTPFDQAGIYRLRVTLEGDGGALQRIPDTRFVVQDPDDDWHTLDSIRDEWPDAEAIPDVSLWGLLASAKVQVIAFAPRLDDDDPVPANYLEAQRIQARNVWNAASVAPDGSVGSDDFIVRPFPLDWHVRQILRPKRAVGGIA